MDTRELTVRTGSARGLADLTAACAGSVDDLMDALDRLLPREDRLYRHRHGSPGHGADHVVPLLASPSLTLPVIGGRLALGTWQSVCLLDPNADNAERTVRLSFIEG